MAEVAWVVLLPPWVRFVDSKRGRVAQVLSFTDHPRELGDNRYVYAVLSRRAHGLSIGVNLNPDKACNFACPYCQVDRPAIAKRLARKEERLNSLQAFRTTPGGPPGIDLVRLEAELDELLSATVAESFWTSPPFDTAPPALRRVADIAFSGDGEPTAPSEFPAAARLSRTLLDRQDLRIPLRLLTNATLLHRLTVRETLGEFDELWCKLDAGTEDYFRRVNGTHLSYGRVLSNLLAVARERPIVLQSLFVTFDGVEPPEEELEAYRGRLAALLIQGGRIDRVQVTTVARRPADPTVGPLSPARLEEIARGARALGLRADVYA